MGKVPTTETIKRATITSMKELKVHKPQYNRLIDLYSEMLHQYLMFNQQFIDEGYKYEVETDNGSVKKAPIVATLETLRKDILAYSNVLCLNPKSLETVTTEKGKASGLAKVLQDLQ